MIGWLIVIGTGIVSSTVPSDLLLFSVFVPLLLLLFHLLCGFNQLSSSFSHEAPNYLSAIAIFFPWPPLLDVSKKRTHQNTAQPEVYLSLNRSLANRLLTAESTYFEKERVACLFCIMVVVSSATGK